MTLKNDNRNKFEREYIKKFESKAARYGIGVEYEEDRAALDWGLHLTIPGNSSFETVTPMRVWFQFKGQSLKTLTREEFDESSHITESIKIDHLRQWYRYAEPVYLAVYVEAVDEFYAVDINRLVDENWGDSVFKDETFVKKAGKARPDTVSIKIPKTELVDEQFWARLLDHRSMRTDGASYRGVPLPHMHDIRSTIPLRMDPSLYAAIVNDILSAHRYTPKATHDPYQLYPGSKEAGDSITLTTGIMLDPYELIPYMTSEIVPDEEGFRVEGSTHKIQGPCAVLVHSHVLSRPDKGMLKELAAVLEKQGIKRLLVFVNHYFLGEPLTGEKAYNCFPAYSAAMGGTEVRCIPQHLEDLGRNILLATNIYMKYRERIRWQGEVLRQKLRDGEVRILE